MTSAMYRWLLISGLVLVGLAIYAKQAHWHRYTVDYLYARMHQGELVAPQTVVLNVGQSPYEKWLERNRNSMPMMETLVINDINTIPLQPWPEMGTGITGLYLRFADYQITDGRLLELPPDSSTFPQRHIYEMGAYVLQGSGHTMIHSENRETEKVPWQAGSLISVPASDTYLHVNTGEVPVRLLVITAFPFLVNSFNNEGFYNEAEWAFEERRAPPGQFTEYYEDTGEIEKRRNFVNDVTQTATTSNPSRGITNRGAYWRMSGNSVLGMHISEFASRSYKKAHRHSSEAFILVVSGSGYSLIWKESGVDQTRIDWRPGTLFVPPTYWFHQHFNPGLDPARYLVINTGQFIKNLGLRFYTQLEIDDARTVNMWRSAIEEQVIGGHAQESSGVKN